MPLLIEQGGFRLHHAKYQQNQEYPHFALTRWLDESREDQIPHYSSHVIGANGLVLHPDCKHVLLVKEKYWFVNQEPQWKFPGGLVDVNEFLCVAAEREVQEETGVEADFKAVVGMQEIPSDFRYGTAAVAFTAF